jgi:acyl-CoA synthetase (NDP forming)
MELECYPCLRSIPYDVDLAMFTVPARMVPDGFRDCFAKGIHAAVVISAGKARTL